MYNRNRDYIEAGGYGVYNTWAQLRAPVDDTMEAIAAWDATKEGKAWRAENDPRNAVRKEPTAAVECNTTDCITITGSDKAAIERAASRTHLAVPPMSPAAKRLHGLIDQLETAVAGLPGPSAVNPRLAAELERQNQVARIKRNLQGKE